MLQAPGCEVCSKLRDSSSASVNNLISSAGCCPLEVTASHWRHITLGTPATDTEGCVGCWRLPSPCTDAGVGHSRGRSNAGQLQPVWVDRRARPSRRGSLGPCLPTMPYVSSRFTGRRATHVPSSQAHGETWVSWKRRGPTETRQACEGVRNGEFPHRSFQKVQQHGDQEAAYTEAAERPAGSQALCGHQCRDPTDAAPLFKTVLGSGVISPGPRTGGRGRGCHTSLQGPSQGLQRT